ncbi:MAG TPA: transporter substrate-binding domain-containing protein [Edaphobacter sp.]|nr:transporter substrate-binding domain-containing protein [Edaphobacter sp.]
MITATAVLGDLAPTGSLRAAINLANAALVQRDPVSGTLTGVSVDLATELASRLGCQVIFITYTAAGQVFDALDKDEWDIAFLAVDPQRATKLTFSPPYVMIEGTYVVAASSPFHSVGDLDRHGNRISVTVNAAYDLFLTRNLKHAQIVRAATPAAALEQFLNGGCEAAAGVRQVLERSSGSDPELRILPDHFTVIQQALAVRSDLQAGSDFLRSFIEEMKETGFVREALDKSGQTDVTVAPVEF